jgi:hypothetical protein
VAAKEKSGKMARTSMANDGRRMIHHDDEIVLQNIGEWPTMQRQHDQDEKGQRTSNRWSICRRCQRKTCCRIYTPEK